MRAREFILEYRRDVTVKNMGDKLFDAFERMHPRLASGIEQFRTTKYLVDLEFQLQDILGRGVTEIEYTIDGTKVTVPADLNAILEEKQRWKPYIINSIVEYFESHDPTPNKQFTPWMIRAYINSPNQIRMEDFNRNNMLGMYQRGKQMGIITPTSSIPSGQNDADIGTFNTYKDFEDQMYEQYVTKIEERLRSTGKVDRGEFEVVYEDDVVRVIHPKDETAACYYGQGTRWCTAATRGSNYFERYNKDGPLYILLPKKPEHEGEKYQIHLDSEQFMDENDEGADSGRLVNRFSGFFDWLKDNDPELRDYIIFADYGLLTALAAKVGEYVEDYVWDMTSDWEQNDDSFHQWQAEQAIERGYYTSELSPEELEDLSPRELRREVEVDWDRVHEDDELNDYLEYNYELKSLINDVKSVTNRADVDALIGAVMSMDESLMKVGDLERVYGYLLKDELGWSNREFAEDIAKRLYNELYIMKPSEKQIEAGVTGNGLKFKPKDLIGGWLVKSKYS